MYPLIAKLRKEKGYSQSDMANLLGEKLRTYQSWERGEYMFNFAQACRIADVLDCTLDELAGRTPPVIEQPEIDPRIVEAKSLLDSAIEDALASIAARQQPRQERQKQKDEPEL
ncbi:MAG: helix-turn-helix transcriptional regulator [Bacteroidaceae bacterium]|nr:helix-turn-helix transcriptional regulator [Bacteroidaceae bacterium]